MDLKQLRTEIDEVDEQIVKLYEQRMRISGQVAEYKRSTGMQVLDAKREEEKLRSVEKMTGEESGRNGVRRLFQELMSQSRELQENILFPEGKGNVRYILASASPRRRELLAMLGIPFRVCVSECEEVITRKDPAEIVEELSFQKAGDVAEKILSENEEPEKVIAVIGADTLVAQDGNILGKPKDRKDAERMLSALQGKIHQVYTGVTVVLVQEHQVKSYRTVHECTQVQFAPMTGEEIREYVLTGDPMDKAGAYGIQGKCGKYIRGIEGDYYNVVGLPVCRLYGLMKELKIL